MSSDLDTLWREFEAETDDHLESLEQLLAMSHSENRNREEISTLFRAFHSLKGAFAVMGMPNAEAVAHRSEDILTLVREGHSALDDELEKLLLETVDRLKEMRDVVVSKRVDAPAPRRLISRLEEYRSRINRPAEPAPSPGREERAGSLGSDPEMLAIFGELLEQRLPDLAKVFSPDRQEQKVALEAAGDLANAAEVLGFDALAGALKNVTPPATDDAAVRSGLIARFDEIRMQTSLVDEAIGRPTGAHALALALRNELDPDYRNALSALARTLSGAGGEPASVLAAVSTCRSLANCLSFEHAVRMLVLLEEQHSRINSGELTDSPKLREIAHRVTGALEDAAMRKEDIETAVYASESLDWQNATEGRLATASDGAVSASGRLVLRPEFRATLSAEQLVRIEQGITDGKRAFEILIDLESDPEVSANILSWLTSAVETVTSRTVFRDGKSYFEFLVLSAETSDWLHAQLRDLDPERLCIEDAREAAAETMAPPASTAKPSTRRTSAYVRVRTDVIGGLMAEVGEMRSLLAALSDSVQNGNTTRALATLRLALDNFDPHVASELRLKIEAIEQDFRAFASLEAKLEAAHRRIWESGLKLRVVPLDALFTRLARAVRDLSERLDKPVEPRVEGGDVRIDKRIVDILADPLMHMVRNAIDHGIEAAAQRIAAGKPARAWVKISAIERSNKVQLIIADDGRGLDKPRILAKAIELGLVGVDEADNMTEAEICGLLLRPGFSTARTVTELSGRGVGMDVVAAALQDLGGSIDVQTTPGVGTSFILTVPLSASLVRSLLVLIKDQMFAIPERQIIAVADVEASRIETIGSDRFYAFRDSMIPVHAVGELLGLGHSESPGADARLVIVSSAVGPMALEVDRILRFQDLFLKELHPILAEVPAIGGASVLGDGRPVLVLDVHGLKGATRAHGEVPARTPAMLA
jgi:two-component system chemotaxis sensor kinase CheA